LGQAFFKSLANFFWEWVYLQLWEKYTEEVKIHNDQQIDELARRQSGQYYRIIHAFVISMVGIFLLAQVSVLVTAKLILFLCPGIFYCVFGAIQISALSVRFTNTRTTEDEHSTKREGIKKALKEASIDFIEHCMFYMSVVWIMWYGSMQVLWGDFALDPINLSDFITFVVLIITIVNDGFWELTRAVADLAHIMGPAKHYLKLKREATLAALAKKYIN